MLVMQGAGIPRIVVVEKGSVRTEDERRSGGEMERGLREGMGYGTRGLRRGRRGVDED